MLPSKTTFRAGGVARTRLASLALALVVPLALASCSQNEGKGGTQVEPNYPTRPVTLVVGDAPGGGFDAMARTFAPLLSDELGVQVRVMNAQGVNFIDFLDQMFQASPDGYTVGFLPSEMFTMHMLRPDLYDQDVRDLEIPTAIEAPKGFAAASTQAPFSNADELLAYEGDVRANSFSGIVPGMISLAVAAEVKDLEFEVNPVVSSNWPEGHLATVRGDVDITFNAASGGPLESVEAGEYVPLFVWGDEPVPDLEGIPTSDDLGFPKELGATQLTRPFVLPPGTPAEHQERISDAVAAVMEYPDMVSWAEEARQALTWVDGEAFWTDQENLVGIYQQHPGIVEALVR